MPSRPCTLASKGAEHDVKEGRGPPCSLATSPSSFVPGWSMTPAQKSRLASEQRTHVPDLGVELPCQ